MTEYNLSELRLYQLISPSLPIGSFTYSQGLEWAIEAQWITDTPSLKHWLNSILEHSIVTLELPILLRLLSAFETSDEASVVRWTQWLLACRETAELRKEEQQRGAALARLLPSLGVSIPENIAMHVAKCQLTGFALAAHQWGINVHKLCYGYCWGWLENIVLAGVKLIPLGQTDGQKIMFELAEKIPSSVEKALSLKDFDIHSSTPALAIASSRHETQYTRLFRS
ncbi:MAG: Urease accessory protein UreF [Cellvibrionales bacterium UBA7375]|nr:MAG: Urease accessory protein UreF [Cellvibrionales bacterium UBA7375]